MKVKIFYPFVLFFNLITICSTLAINYESFSVNDSINGEFTILKIIRDKKAYIIHVSDNKDTTLYAIVSLKEKARMYKKIKIGKSYKMLLIPYYNYDYVPDHAYLFEIDLEEGVTICIPGNSWMSNIYLTPDLRGLHYLSQ